MAVYKEVTGVVRLSKMRRAEAFAESCEKRLELLEMIHVIASFKHPWHWLV
ncbi:hypothetical protein WN944_015483 [Citrus x changshan-huyou]|uniref:Uncharacterized protein n=1 Tax=Citrus x changshan-huyou TaxID=2935761 RepID=A0AAP0QLU3_9ROSI